MYNGYQTENVSGKLAQHARSKPVEISSGIFVYYSLNLAQKNHSKNQLNVYMHSMCSFHELASECQPEGFTLTANHTTVLT